MVCVLSVRLQIFTCLVESPPGLGLRQSSAALELTLKRGKALLAFVDGLLLAFVENLTFKRKSSKFRTPHSEFRTGSTLGFGLWTSSFRAPNSAFRTGNIGDSSFSISSF
jgi:hypothetical protein